MDKKTKSNSEVVSFFGFLKEKNQKRRLLAFGIFYLVVYIALVFLYPYADGISDTGGYIQSAIKNMYLGYRPFGYSEFFILVHGFSKSLGTVVFAQYWLNAISTVLFILTIKYFFPPKNKIAELVFEVLS